MDDIQVFTPKGKGIILPKGATALDFAYKIHSWIGQHAVNARINGQLMSVKTVLNYGDCVKIDTDEHARPGADWIDNVRTKSAKRHLHNYILSVLNNEYKPCPHCHPIPGDNVIGFKADDGTITLHRNNCQTVMTSQQGEYMPAIEFYEDDFLYRVRVKVVRSVEHYNWKTDDFHKVIDRSKTIYITQPTENIVVYKVDFEVHSANDLDGIIKSFYAFEGVDEVQRVDIE